MANASQFDTAAKCRGCMQYLIAFTDMIGIQRLNKWNKQWSDNRKYHPNHTCTIVIEAEYQLAMKSF